MKIFVVDDSDIKLKKIKGLIEEILDPNSFELFVSKNNADAMQILLNQTQIDLMILDMNLPIRKNSPVKKLAGLKLINEINRRNDINKPECIIGLTAYKAEEIESKIFFENEGWAIIHFNIKNSDWEVTIGNKLKYLLSKKSFFNGSKMNAQKILFVASSPSDQDYLNAGVEQRKIDEMLKTSTKREEFELISKPGAKLETLTRELMQHNPQYVHFTGHGDADGLAMEEDNGSTAFIPALALENLFQLFSGIVKCVFLSACYSSKQAKAISKFNIFVVGMNNSVGVNSATEFSKGFYQAIGEGKDVLTAFKFGLVHLTSNDISQKDIPEIWHNGQKLI